MSIPAPLIAGIINGDYDDDMERIVRAINERRRFIRDQQSAQTLFTLRPGMRVRLHGLTPKYINGLEGEVVDVARGNSKRVTVRLDHPVQRFGTTVRPPATCVEVIS